MKRISARVKEEARVYSREMDRQTNGLTHEEIAEAIEQYVEAAWLAGYRYEFEISPAHPKCNRGHEHLTKEAVVACNERYGPIDARLANALKLRREGMTYKAIGTVLGVSSERARSLVIRSESISRGEKSGGGIRKTTG